MVDMKTKAGSRGQAEQQVPVESVNSTCEQNSVHGPLLQRVAFALEERNDS